MKRNRDSLLFILLLVSVDTTASIDLSVQEQHAPVALLEQLNLVGTVADVDASTISGLIATDIALILPCDEESDGTVQVDRLDISGNGYDFTDNNTAASIDLPIP